jgi:DNA-directed RNA polymerase specialized sigma24 family protein
VPNLSRSQPNDRDLARLFTDLMDLAAEYADIAFSAESSPGVEDDLDDRSPSDALEEFFVANHSELLDFLARRTGNRAVAEAIARESWEAFLHVDGLSHSKPVHLLYTAAKRLLQRAARMRRRQVEALISSTNDRSEESRDASPPAKDTHRRPSVDAVKGLFRGVARFLLSLPTSYFGEPATAARASRAADQSAELASLAVARTSRGRHSSMFVGSLVAAISATACLFSLFLLQVLTPPPPPPPGVAGPGSVPPAELFSPQSLTSAIVIAAAIFAISWIATIAATIRDQILWETNRIMSDYGDLRETDGYVSGYQQRGRPEAEVRQLYPIRPAD